MTDQKRPNLRHPLVSIALAPLLTGCALSTGVVPAGSGTYTVSERYAPTQVGAEQAAMTEANLFCARQGRQFLPVDARQAPGVSIQPNIYSITFRCLLPDDPELQHPYVVQTPNSVQHSR